MADVVHTPTGALAGANPTIQPVTWGGTVTGGMPVYEHTDSKHYAALNDTLLHAAVKGYALSAGSIGQRGSIITSGALTLSGGMTKGVVYYCSPNGGGIAPVADVASADYVFILGVATSTTNLKIINVASGVALD